jgi:hypothetical protein
MDKYTYSQLQNMDKRELARVMLGPAGTEVKVQLQRKKQTRIETLMLVRGSDLGAIDDHGAVSSQMSWK